jgi:serine/threonine-protein kinase
LPRTVGGRYRIVAALGGGAISEVSLAVADPPAKGAKLVVVKRLKLGTDADKDVFEQFADEARVSIRLDHPNIVRTIAANEDSEGPFLVLEYLEGQTLARIRSRAAKRKGGMPHALALQIVMGIATALAYMHEAKDDAGKPAKLVHRDVSPDNVVITYAGETKLIDFSLAYAGSAKPRSDATKGNVAYMSPEQVKSAVGVDARADVFALGLVLWELLTGKRMWEGKSEAEVVAKLLDDAELPTVRSVAPDVPEALEAICTKALTKVRDERYDTASDMKEAIESAMRKLGLKTSSLELAELVSGLFEEDRKKMDAMVAEAVAAPHDSSRALPQLRPAAPSIARFEDAPSDPQLVAASRVPVAVVKVEQPSRDRRFTLLVIGAVLIAFAGVAVVAITSQGQKGDSLDDTTPSGTPRPRAPLAVDAATSAWVEPTEITVEISVTPNTAKLYIDGVKTDGSRYRTKVVPGKFVHEVRAEADGYETKTEKFAFDRERTIEIALAPSAKPGQPPPPPHH